MRNLIYLDNAATTFPKPEAVYQALDRANRELAVNAGRGSYQLARQATKLIDDTKGKLLNLLHVTDSVQVVFSPSVTIALNQIINGIEWPEEAVIYVSPFEHNAVARVLHYLLLNKRIKIKELPIKKRTYEIDVEKMKYEFVKDKPDAVFCTHVSNVTGYILPVQTIFAESKRYECLNIMDAAQSMGIVPIDCSELDVDIIAFAGHKTLYGPFGIGGFINITGITLKEFIIGGTGTDSLNLSMPKSGSEKYEAASMNIPAIAGLNAALDTLDIDNLRKNEQILSEYLVSSLKEIPGVILYGPEDISQQIGIISFTLEGFDSEDVGEILDEDFNIAVRTGYHCAPLIHKYLKDENQSGTVRVGIGRFNTKEELDKLLEAVRDIVR
ncbi:MAG: aminotransferase class V-fold PLP-dependent enzyme [Lachnospiraceae bacterium]|nr:aminotransferase class V-fold PLP-dependent enzyme [Lachnospiraceae bacterium]